RSLRFLRCAYHANVMKTFEHTRRNAVVAAVVIFLSEGLRPSDSSHALSRAVLAGALRSRGSLALSLALQAARSGTTFGVRLSPNSFIGLCQLAHTAFS